MSQPEPRQETASDRVGDAIDDYVRAVINSELDSVSFQITADRGPPEEK